MKRDSSQRYFTYFLALILVGVFCTSPAALSAAKTEVECAVCGMKTTAEAKNGFQSTRDGKAIHFCSFACAHRFHSSKAHREAPLLAHDYKTGAAVSAESAYYLAKSKNIEKELEFDMPPSVIAFSSEPAAKETQTRLKDGEIVRGFEALARIYQ